MSAHTPGPWHVNEQPNDLVRIIGGVDGDTYDDGSPRMIYTHVCDVIDNEDEQANARLIAKAPIAPKLAEALRDCIGSLQSCASWIPHDSGGAIAREVVHAEVIRYLAALAEWDAQ